MAKYSQHHLLCQWWNQEKNIFSSCDWQLWVSFCYSDRQSAEQRHRQSDSRQIICKPILIFTLSSVRRTHKTLHKGKAGLHWSPRRRTSMELSPGNPFNSTPQPFKQNPSSQPRHSGETPQSEASWKPRAKGTDAIRKSLPPWAFGAVETWCKCEV